MNDRDWAFLLGELKEIKESQNSIIEMIHVNNLNATVSISNLKVKIGFISAAIAFVFGLIGTWISNKV